MINPTRVTSVLVGVLCLISLAGGNSAAAGPVTATATEALISPPPPTPPGAAPRPRVYLFRGAMGPIFSTGIDRLGEKLEQAGIPANVYEFTICRLIAAQAIHDYRESPAPIVLIGHSMGGLCAVKFAERT